MHKENGSDFEHLFNIIMLLIFIRIFELNYVSWHDIIIFVFRLTIVIFSNNVKNTANKKKQWRLHIKLKPFTIPKSWRLQTIASLF